MIPYWSLNGSQLYQGHVLDVLRALAAGSVHCVVTSPPYWGLRDYSLPPIEWPAVSYAPMAGLPPVEIEGCAEGCEHVWEEEQHRVMTGGGVESSTLGVLSGGHGMSEDGHKRTLERSRYDASQGQHCQLCGGWRGCLGLEPTVEMFVGHIVLVARELWRVLRDDGTFWLNFGDSYSGGGGYAPDAPSNQGGGMNRRAKEFESSKRRAAGNLKPKDLIGIPWRVAFALQADGWYLRSDIVWAKGVSFCSTYSGSCMPESVTDRPTKGHEYVFLLAKSKSYFYDAEAVKEGASQNTHSRGPEYHKLNKTQEPGLGIKDNESWSEATWGPVSSRNLRTVWLINPGSYAGAHFATFPPALVEPMIKAGTSERGCCPECGAPWERVTEKEKFPTRPGNSSKYGPQNEQWRCSETSDFHERRLTTTTTTGWRPTCFCDAGEPVPCTVLDPFGGSGTSAEVAIRLRRRVVLIELSKEYCDEHIIPRLSEPIQMELAL